MENPLNIVRGWLTRHPAARVHPAGMIACALLVATFAFHTLVVQPGEEKVRALRDALARHTRPAAVTAVSTDAANEPAQKLGAFYAFFRRDLKFSDWLARIYDIADRAGIRVTQADYRLSEATDGPLLRYELVLPLSGDYGRIRSFAEGVLNAVPVASLDRIAFRRQRSTQGDVEADVQLTLYLAAPQ